MKREYTMTELQLSQLLAASEPVRYMVFGGRPPRSPQENVNAAWRSLASEMHFKFDTVEPIPGAAQGCFLAEPEEDEG